MRSSGHCRGRRAATVAPIVYSGTRAMQPNPLRVNDTCLWVDETHFFCWNELRIIQKHSLAGRYLFCSTSWAHSQATPWEPGRCIGTCLDSQHHVQPRTSLGQEVPLPFKACARLCPCGCRPRGVNLDHIYSGAWLRNHLFPLGCP
jgi:hypothetical protein